MKRAILAVLLVVTIMLALGVWGCDSGSTTPDGDSEGCPDGQALGPDGKCHDIIIPDGDKTDGDVADGDTITDGDKVDGDAVDGDTSDGDKTDGDAADGDPVDGDVVPDGDTPDGDVVDGDVIDGDTADGDVTDGDTTDGDTADGDILPDGDTTDGDVVDSDIELGACGGPCLEDTDCNPGCYCGPQNECTKDCEAGLEFVCSPNCCNYTRGRCEACVDGDEDEDVDGPIICSSNENCPIYHFCNGLNICQSDCTPEAGCTQEGFYCNDLGQCVPLPDDDGESDAVARRMLHNCKANTDCLEGEICDSIRNVCVPGCKRNTDCPPEAPICAQGICY